MGFSVLVIALLPTIALLNFAAQLSRRQKTSAGLRKLPGPKGYPLIGNVHELPAKKLWLKFHHWFQQYGPIYQVNLAGVNHVWIGRDDIAHDLLTKRSTFYSNRPHIPALEADNRTSGHYLPLMSRNDGWMRQRRFSKQMMGRSLRASFFDYPELEAVRLLHELLNKSSHPHDAMESFVARVTCRLAWGTSTPAEELKQRARELLISVSPNGALGNMLPIVMWLPEWLVPAKAWERRRQRTEQKFFRIMQETVSKELPDFQSMAFSASKARSTRSWMHTYLENKSSWSFKTDLEGAYSVGMHAIAGALTIASPMHNFCLAMCTYPQFQPMLHEEVDRVLGERLPVLADLPSMPVLRAFIRETMRWRPPIPTGIPHLLSQDDIYNGYFIPAGSVVHPLEWSIVRDPEIYVDPEDWNPTRWLDPKYPTYREPLSRYPTIADSTSQFGYGSRVCLGIDLTEADLFVGIGSVAWLFSIHANERTPGAGTQNAPSIDVAEYSTLLIAKPMPFEFELHARKEKRAAAITEKWRELREAGEYEGDVMFWKGRDGKPSNEGDCKYGWGEVVA